MLTDNIWSMSFEEIINFVELRATSCLKQNDLKHKRRISNALMGIILLSIILAWDWSAFLWDRRNSSNGKILSNLNLSPLIFQHHSMFTFTAKWDVKNFAIIFQLFWRFLNKLIMYFLQERMIKRYRYILFLWHQERHYFVIQ